MGLLMKVSGDGERWSGMSEAEVDVDGESDEWDDDGCIC